MTTITRTGTPEKLRKRRDHAQFESGKNMTQSTRYHRCISYSLVMFTPSQHTLVADISAIAAAAPCPAICVRSTKQFVMRGRTLPCNLVLSYSLHCNPYCNTDLLLLVIEDPCFDELSSKD